MAEDSECIEDLICNLASNDDSIRKKAFVSLVTLGEKAVPLLIKVLNDPNDTVRWEAAKALGDIGNPEAAPALVRGLEDEEFGIIWAAAEGLIKMNVKGLRVLLQALWARPHESLLCEGAHHVIHDLAKGGLRRHLIPVL